MTSARLGTLALAATGVGVVGGLAYFNFRPKGPTLLKGSHANPLPVPSSDAAAKRIPAVAERLRRLWPEVTGESGPMPPAALEIALAQAWLESGVADPVAGGWWKDKTSTGQGDMTKSGNLGARQCGKGDSGGDFYTCVPYGDSMPMPDGSQKQIEASFRHFKAGKTPDGKQRDAADAAAWGFLTDITKQWPALAELKSGDVMAYAKKQYANHYYGGFGATPEERIAGYGRAIASHLPAVAAALGHDKIHAVIAPELVKGGAKHVAVSGLGATPYAWTLVDPDWKPKAARFDRANASHAAAWRAAVVPRSEQGREPDFVRTDAGEIADFGRYYRLSEPWRGMFWLSSVMPDGGMVRDPEAGRLPLITPMDGPDRGRVKGYPCDPLDWSRGVAPCADVGGAEIEGAFTAAIAATAGVLVALGLIGGALTVVAATLIAKRLHKAGIDLVKPGASIPEGLVPANLQDPALLAALGERATEILQSAAAKGWTFAQKAPVAGATIEGLGTDIAIAAAVAAAAGLATSVALSHKTKKSDHAEEKLDQAVKAATAAATSPPTPSAPRASAPASPAPSAPKPSKPARPHGMSASPTGEPTGLDVIAPIAREAAPSGPAAPSTAPGEGSFKDGKYSLSGAELLQVLHLAGALPRARFVPVTEQLVWYLETPPSVGATKGSRGPPSSPGKEERSGVDDALATAADATTAATSAVAAIDAIQKIAKRHGGPAEDPQCRILVKAWVEKHPILARITSPDLRPLVAGAATTAARAGFVDRYVDELLELRGASGDDRTKEQIDDGLLVTGDEDRAVLERMGVPLGRGGGGHGGGADAGGGRGCATCGHSGGWFRHGGRGLCVNCGGFWGDGHELLDPWEDADERLVVITEGAPHDGPIFGAIQDDAYKVARDASAGIVNLFAPGAGEGLRTAADALKLQVDKSTDHDPGDRKKAAGKPDALEAAQKEIATIRRALTAQQAVVAAYVDRHPILTSITSPDLKSLITASANAPAPAADAPTKATKSHKHKQGAAA